MTQDEVFSAAATGVIIVAGIIGFLAMITGCAPQETRNLTGNEEEYVVGTVNAWDEWSVQNPGYEPISDSCYLEMMDLGVYVAHTHEEMYAVTGLCGPESAEFPDGYCPPGAGRASAEARVGYLDRNRLIVIVETVLNGPEACSVFSHEVLHHLINCMGYRADLEHQGWYWPRSETNSGIWGACQ